MYHAIEKQLAGGQLATDRPVYAGKTVLKRKLIPGR